MFGFQRALQSEEPPAHLINVEHLRSTMTGLRSLAELGMNPRSAVLHLKDFFLFFFSISFFTVKAWDPYIILEMANCLKYT